MDLFQKEIIANPDFYIVKFTKQPALPYFLFIHGGPGFHCGVLDYLIENNELFQAIDCNIILYDQRNCGRSPLSEQSINHNQNVGDLSLIVSLIQKTYQLKLGALMGHSYGAKILADYAKISPTDIPLIFVATSESLLRPRLNNLMLDFAYLKQTHPQKYNEIFNSIQEVDHSKLWELSETLASYFQKNVNRGSIYWANTEWYGRVQELQTELNIPINLDVFASVRKDIYSNKEHLTCDISSIEGDKLWITGFHDFIMDGQMAAFSYDPNIITFYQSAHYPHIEENERFCRVVNEFLQDKKN